DVQGRTIKETKLAQGENTIKIETSTFASGVYYIRIVTDTINRTEKLIKK
ncbi:MAG: T9SS type A sorting domain-containing protein, partial [Bacteroidales bacterium]|nr:T9SS type A sorting domain-containing protein [Bacteroidales bacterium]